MFKFSPEGKVLLTLGKAGGSAGSPDVVLSAERRAHRAERRHLRVGRPRRRATRASEVRSDGKFIKSFGKKGSGPGEFEQPHALAIDSRGRLFVGDRSNNRIQILDQNGKLLDTWYAVQPVERDLHRQERHDLRRGLGVRVRCPAARRWKRGIRIGSAPRSGREGDGNERGGGRRCRRPRKRLRR